MPSVPNWIPRAVIYGRWGTVTPITGYRATRTQVVVTTAGNRERRFRLDNLHEVGRPHYGADVLMAPDNPRVVAALRKAAISDARYVVISAVESARMQDITEDGEAALAALFTIRAAVDKAIVDLDKAIG